MILAEIRSQDEQDAISNMLDIADPHGALSYWLGIEDFKVIFAFRYASSGEKLTYTNWQVYQPNNDHGTGQYCVRMYPPNIGYSRQWDDDNCFFLRNVVCQTAQIG